MEKLLSGVSWNVGNGEASLGLWGSMEYGYEVERVGVNQTEEREVRMEILGGSHNVSTCIEVTELPYYGI